MRQKTEKKLFSFMHFPFIDRILKDISISEGKTESLIAEEILLGARPPLLPRNEEASTIIQSLYTSDDAVTEMYRNVFGQISALISREYCPDKERILIDSLYSALCRFRPTCQEKNGPALTWYIKQLSAFLEELEQIYTQMPERDFDEQFRLQKEIRFGKDLLNELETEPEHMPYHHIVNLIQNTWSFMRNSSTTYRLLTAQMQLIFLPNTPENRLYAVQYIAEASANWPAP